jgi:hypothetical protein
MGSASQRMLGLMHLGERLCLVFGQVLPVDVAILMYAGRQIVRMVNVTQSIGDGEAEVMLSDSFVGQEATDTHFSSMPHAVQVAGVGWRLP